MLYTRLLLKHSGKAVTIGALFIIQIITIANAHRIWKVERLLEEKQEDGKCEGKPL